MIPAPPEVRDQRRERLRLIVRVCLVAAVLYLAIGALVHRYVSPDTEAAAPPAPTPTLSSRDMLADDDARYVAAVGAIDYFADYTDLEIIEVGHLICDRLNGGMRVNAAGRRAMKSGLDPTEAGLLVGLTVASYCPSHGAQIESP